MENLKCEIKKLSLNKDDILLLRSKKPLSVKERYQLYSGIQKIIDNKVILLPDKELLDHSVKDKTNTIKYLEQLIESIKNEKE